MSLFPYHSSCYPLLDAYECLGDYTLSSEDICPSSLFLYKNESNDDDTFNGYLPNSLDAILTSMNNLERIEDFPGPPSNKIEILLKLLRHSMSDLQSDYRLASHVIKQFKKWNYFMVADIFRKVISIVLAERKYCNGNCSRVDNNSEEQDHDCTAWTHLAQSIGAGIASCGSGFTREHALIVAAAVKLTYDEANPGAGLREDNVALGIQNGASAQVKMKLKQALYLWKRTDFDDYDSDHEEKQVREIIPYHFFGSLIKHLGESVMKDRLSLQKHDISDVSGRLLRLNKIKSIQNTIATFAFLGELSTRRLPVNSDSIRFCSTLIQTIVTAYVGPMTFSIDLLKYRANGQPDLPSIIDPNRYSNAILASRFHRKVPVFEEIVGIIRPPNDIFDVIRCLFSRSLVDILHACCGYGDCLVWLGGEITAHDPLLFVHEYNYPIDSENGSVWLMDEVFLAENFTSVVVVLRFVSQILVFSSYFHRIMLLSSTQNLKLVTISRSLSFFRCGTLRGHQKVITHSNCFSGKLSRQCY